MVSKEQLEHYVELTVKQFADNSAGIRWCPYPDCGYAICIKNEAKQASASGGGRGGGGGRSRETGKKKEKERTDRGEGGAAEAAAGAVAQDLPFQPGWNVECGRGHGFCWYVIMYMYM